GCSCCMTGSVTLSRRISKDVWNRWEEVAMRLCAQAFASFPCTTNTPLRIGSGSWRKPALRSVPRRSYAPPTRYSSPRQRVRREGNDAQVRLFPLPPGEGRSVRQDVTRPCVDYAPRSLNF